MARMTKILLFMLVLNATIIYVNTWGLFPNQPALYANSQYTTGVSGATQPCSGLQIAGQNSKYYAQCAGDTYTGLFDIGGLSLASLAVLLTFGDFAGTLLLYTAFFAALLALPTLFLLQLGVPVYAVIILSTALWFTWVIEMLQIRSGRYLWD